jgi:hypothetical protein
VPSSLGTPELGYEPSQLQRITDIVEARLRQEYEETTQATHALSQAQGDLLEQCSTTE